MGRTPARPPPLPPSLLPCLIKLTIGDARRIGRLIVSSSSSSSAPSSSAGTVVAAAACHGDALVVAGRLVLLYTLPPQWVLGLVSAAELAAESMNERLVGTLRLAWVRRAWIGGEIVRVVRGQYGLERSPKSRAQRQYTTRVLGRG